MAIPLDQLLASRALTDAIDNGPVTSKSKLLPLHQRVDSLEGHLLHNLALEASPAEPVTLLTPNARYPSDEMTMGWTASPRYYMFATFNRLLTAPVLKLMTVWEDFRSLAPDSPRLLKVTVNFHFNRTDKGIAGITRLKSFKIAQNDKLYDELRFTSFGATSEGLPNAFKYQRFLGDHGAAVIAQLEDFLKPLAEQRVRLAFHRPLCAVDSTFGALLPYVTGPSRLPSLSQPSWSALLPLKTERDLSELLETSDYPFVPFDTPDTYPTVTDAVVELYESACIAQVEQTVALQEWASVSHPGVLYSLGGVVVMAVTFDLFRTPGGAHFSLPDSLSCKMSWTSPIEGTHFVLQEARHVSVPIRLPPYDALFVLTEPTSELRSASIPASPSLDRRFITRVEFAPKYQQSSVKNQLMTAINLQHPDSSRWHDLILNQRHDFDLIDLGIKRAPEIEPTVTREAVEEAFSKMLQAEAWNIEQLNALHSVRSALGGVSLITGPAGTGKTLVLQAITAFLRAVGLHVLVLTPANSNASDYTAKMRRHYPDVDLVRCFPASQSFSPDKIAKEKWNKEHSQDDAPNTEGDGKLKSTNADQTSDVVDLLGFEMIRANLQAGLQKYTDEECSLPAQVLRAAREGKYSLKQGSAEIDIWSELRACIKKNDCGEFNWLDKPAVQAYEKFYAACKNHFMSFQKLVVTTTGNCRCLDIVDNFARDRYDNKCEGLAIIIDEACKDREIDTLSALLIPDYRERITGLVMLGDERQLEPTNTSAKGKVEFNPFSGRLSLPFLTRLKRQGFPCVELKEQHRMSYHISRWPSATFYPDGAMRDGPGTFKTLKSTQPGLFACLKGILDGIGSRAQASDVAEDKRVRCQYLQVKGTRSERRVKEHPRLFFERIYWALFAYYGVSMNDSVMVVCAYKNQKQAWHEVIGHLQQKYQIPTAAFPTLSTIDSSQGCEAPITILDCSIQAYSDDSKLRDVGFCDDDRRMNVAFTRAREVRWVIGGDCQPREPWKRGVKRSYGPSTPAYVRYRDSIEASQLTVIPGAPLSKAEDDTGSWLDKMVKKEVELSIRYADEIVDNENGRDDSGSEASVSSTPSTPPPAPVALTSHWHTAHHKLLFDALTQDTVTEDTDLAALYAFNDYSSDGPINDLLENCTRISKPKVKCSLVTKDGVIYPPEDDKVNHGYQMHLIFNKLLYAPRIRLESTLKEHTIALEVPFNYCDSKQLFDFCWVEDEIAFEAKGATCEGFNNVVSSLPSFNDEQKMIYTFLLGLIDAQVGERLKFRLCVAELDDYQRLQLRQLRMVLPGGDGPQLPSIGVPEYSCFPSGARETSEAMRYPFGLINSSQPPPMVPLPAGDTCTSLKEFSVQHAVSTSMQYWESTTSLRDFSRGSHRVTLFASGEYAVIAMSFGDIPDLEPGVLASRPPIKLPNGLEIDIEFHIPGLGARSFKAHYEIEPLGLPENHNAFFIILNVTPSSFGDKIHQATEIPSWYADVLDVQPHYNSFLYDSQIKTIEALPTEAYSKWHPIALNQLHAHIPQVDVTAGLKVSSEKLAAALKWLRNCKPWNPGQMQLIDSIHRTKDGLILCSGIAGSGKTEMSIALAVFSVMLGGKAVVTGTANTNADSLGHLAEEFTDALDNKKLRVYRIYTGARKVKLSEISTQQAFQRLAGHEGGNVTSLNSMKFERYAKKTKNIGAMQCSLSSGVLDEAEKGELSMSCNLHYRSFSQENVCIWDVFRSCLAADDDGEFDWKSKSSKDIYQAAFDACKAHLLALADIIVCTNGNIRCGEGEIFSREARKQEIAFLALLMDEVAKEMEINIFNTITADLPRSPDLVVFFGDERQLQPINTCSRDPEFNPFNERLSLSLFTRLIRQGFPYTQLTVQERMSNVLSRFPNQEFYGGILTDSPKVQRPLEDVKPGLTKVLHGIIADSMSNAKDRKDYLKNATDEMARLHYIEMPADDFVVDDKFSVVVPAHVNVFFERILADLQSYFGAEMSAEVMLIVVYGHAVKWYERRIYKLKKEQKLDHLHYPKVLTIDSGPGEEATMVLMDGSMQYDELPGFLTDSGRANTALTRAKEVFWLLGGPLHPKPRHPSRDDLDDLDLSPDDPESFVKLKSQLHGTGQVHRFSPKTRYEAKPHEKQKHRKKRFLRRRPGVGENGVEE